MSSKKYMVKKYFDVLRFILEYMCQVKGKGGLRVNLSNTSFSGTTSKLLETGVKDGCRIYKCPV